MRNAYKWLCLKAWCEGISVNVKKDMVTGQSMVSNKARYLEKRVSLNSSKKEVRASLCCTNFLGSISINNESKCKVKLSDVNKL